MEKEASGTNSLRLFLMFLFFDFPFLFVDSNPDSVCHFSLIWEDTNMHICVKCDFSDLPAVNHQSVCVQLDCIKISWLCSY